MADISKIQILDGDIYNLKDLEGRKNISALIQVISNILETTSPDSFPIYDTASNNIISFNDGADGVPMKSLVVNIEAKQAGTGDPSPENIRPLSGWTMAEISKTGRNLLNGVYTNESIAADGTISSTSSARLSGFIPTDGKTITFSIKHIEGAGSSGLRICNYDENKNFISRIVSSIADETGYLTKTIDYSNSSYQTIKYVRVNAFTTSDDVNTFMVEYSTVQGEYEAPGTIITADWSSVAGTVYGGTLTINPDMTGTLVVDKGVKVLNGTETWTWNKTDKLCATAVSNGIITDRVTQFHRLTRNSTFYDKAWTEQNSNDGTLGMFYGSSRLYVKYSEFTSAADATAFFTENPTTVVYKLATPATYQLTETEISGILTTLKGINNIWADCGDVSVEYPTDTNLYINKKIQEIIS